MSIYILGVLSLWDEVKQLTHIRNIPSEIPAIVNWIAPLAKTRSIRSVICKLVLAATCYFIWIERNMRIFKKVKRTREQPVASIKASVRLKLLSCSFKRTSNAERILHSWELPSSLIKGDCDPNAG